MVDMNKVNGRMRELNLTNKDVADGLGISETAWYAKKRKGVLDSDEIEKLIVLLKLEDPLEYPLFFFANKSPVA